MTQAVPPIDRPFRNQAARYATLSVLSFTANLGLFVVLHEWAGFASYIAVALAMALVTVMNFCTLRLFVFDRTGRRWGTQFVGYVASTAGFRLGEYAVFVLLCGWLAMPYLPTYAGVLACSVVGKFLFLRGCVFSRRASTPCPVEVAL